MLNFFRVLNKYNSPISILIFNFVQWILWKCVLIFFKSSFFSFKDTSHTDFVSSLSWQGNDNLFTCGWDSKVKNHSVSKSVQTCEDCVVVHMETDCIDKENVKKKIANISLVCNGNGAGLESTWCASTSIRYIPDVPVFCDSL